MSSLSTHISRQKGFTLIELTLYISLLAIMLFALALLLTAVFEARERHQSITEVEQQGSQIMETIIASIESVRRTDGTQNGVNWNGLIIAPLLGQSGTTLSLNTA